MLQLLVPQDAKWDKMREAFHSTLNLAFRAINATTATPSQSMEERFAGAYRADERVLFVAKNVALCCFVVQWMCRRFKRMGDRKLQKLVLDRLHVW